MSEKDDGAGGVGIWLWRAIVVGVMTLGFTVFKEAVDRLDNIDTRLNVLETKETMRALIDERVIGAVRDTRRDLLEWMDRILEVLKDRPPEDYRPRSRATKE